MGQIVPKDTSCLVNVLGMLIEFALLVLFVRTALVLMFVDFTLHRGFICIGIGMIYVNGW